MIIYFVPIKRNSTKILYTSIDGLTRPFVNKWARCYYGHFQINRHYLNSILTNLSQSDCQTVLFASYSWWAKQIHKLDSIPYWPLTHFFIFWVPPFWFLVPFRTNSTRAPETLASNVFFYGARYFWKIIFLDVSLRL